MLNLDTHILLDAIDLHLSRAEERLLERDAWCISAIVLWEIEMLARSGRVKVDLATRELLNVLEHVRIIPIDINIARSVRRLDFRSDPADEIIAATSLQMNIPLVTRDANILASKVVPLVRS